MGTGTYTFSTKRPNEATPEQMAKLRAAGLKLREIAKLYGISRQRVHQLLAKTAPGLKVHQTRKGHKKGEEDKKSPAG